MAHRAQPATFDGPLRQGLLCACVLLAAAKPADAFEVSGGVGLGGILAGSKPRFAVTPHAGVTWRMESGFLVTAHEMLSILPATDEHGVGVYNRTSVLVGYAAKGLIFSAGPSLSIYSMIACNAASLCGRVVGLSPGAYAHADVYFAGPLGVSVSAGVDWIGGKSLVLPGDVVAMVIAGPVLRWTRR